MPGRTQMVDQRLHTFNWISLAAGHGFLRALAERISLQQALRHRFARCWYQPRVGTATPASAALLLAQLPCPAMPPCVPPLSCEIGAFRAAAENLGPWCVGTGRDGAAGYSSSSKSEEVSAARVSPSAARHVTPRTLPPSHLSSTGAVKQETFNSSLGMEQSSWVRFEEEEETTLETSRRRSKNISTSSSLSSSLSSIGSTSMEKRMADFTAALDVEQFSAHLNDKYAVLQDLHATSDNLGWSSLILNGTQEGGTGQRQ